MLLLTEWVKTERYDYCDRLIAKENFVRKMLIGVLSLKYFANFTSF